MVCLRIWCVSRWSDCIWLTNWPFVSLSPILVSSYSYSARTICLNVQSILKISWCDEHPCSSLCEQVFDALAVSMGLPNRTALLTALPLWVSASTIENTKYQDFLLISILLETLDYTSGHKFVAVDYIVRSKDLQLERGHWMTYPYNSFIFSYIVGATELSCQLVYTVLTHKSTFSYTLFIQRWCTKTCRISWHGNQYNMPKCWVEDWLYGALHNADANYSYLTLLITVVHNRAS